MKSLYWMVVGKILAVMVLGLLAPAGLVILAEQEVQTDRANPEICEDITPAWQAFAEHEMFQGTLLLAREGQVLCEWNRGTTGAGLQDQPIDQYSRFAIASLSKPIVASLLLRLQEIGVLDLQKSVAHYLPDFDAPWASQVTLHHLLANRSGLANHFALPGWGSGQYQQDMASKTLLAIIANMQLAFPPGSDYLYSNVGWLVLEAVVQKVTGKDLETNLQRHIFDPLNMGQSGLVGQSKDSVVTGLRFGAGGGWQPQRNLNMQVFNGGAGIYASASDLLRYANALHQGQLLTAASRTQLFSVDTPYGWRSEPLELSDTVTLETHNYDGQLLGHSSLLYQIPDEGLTLILLSRTGMGFAHKKALATAILQAYYQLPFNRYPAAPSLLLQRSIVGNRWDKTFASVSQQPIENAENALLLHDLAQQLAWSGNEGKAIQLYAWLVRSFPDNQGLQQLLVRLCEQHKDAESCGSTLKVGMQVLPLKDPARNAWRKDTPRPITTHLFYPTLEGKSEALLLGPPQAPLFNAGSVVKDALPTTGRHPLILMSHGTGGSAPQMLWLAQALVQQGYWVAAVNHHGNTALEAQKYPEGFLLWWERARDLEVVRQQLIQDAKWQRFIDPEQMAVVGFSLGGYTTLAALGGITDKALFDQYCQQATDDFSCQAQPEFNTVLEAFERVKNTPQVLQSNAGQHHSYRIPGLKAAVAIAPAVVHSFRANSLKQITTPTLLLVGSQDRIAPDHANAQYAHSLLPNSQLSEIKNAHHYSFLSLCTEQGKNRVPSLCEQPYGVSREAVHQSAIKDVVVFLGAYLNGAKG